MIDWSRYIFPMNRNGHLVHWIAHFDWIFLFIFWIRFAFDFFVHSFVRSFIASVGWLYCTLNVDTKCMRIFVNIHFQIERKRAVTHKTHKNARSFVHTYLLRFTFTKISIGFHCANGLQLHRHKVGVQRNQFWQNNRNNFQHIFLYNFPLYFSPFRLQIFWVERKSHIKTNKMLMMKKKNCSTSKANGE